MELRISCTNPSKWRSLNLYRKCYFKSVIMLTTFVNLKTNWIYLKSLIKPQTIWCSELDMASKLNRCLLDHFCHISNYFKQICPSRIEKWQSSISHFSFQTKYITVPAFNTHRYPLFMTVSTLCTSVIASPGGNGARCFLSYKSFGTYHSSWHGTPDPI